MRRPLALVLLMTLAFGPQPSLAAFASGNTFLSDCEGETDFLEGTCAGYAIAIFDSLADNSINGFGPVCPSGDVSKAQVRDIAIAWLKNHPEIRHFAAPGLIAKALEEAFPC